jgi:hypothetical protein
MAAFYGCRESQLLCFSLRYDSLFFCSRVRTASLLSFPIFHLDFFSSALLAAVTCVLSLFSGVVLAVGFVIVVWRTSFSHSCKQSSFLVLAHVLLPPLTLRFPLVVKTTTKEVGSTDSDEVTTGTTQRPLSASQCTYVRRTRKTTPSAFFPQSLRVPSRFTHTHTQEKKAKQSKRTKEKPSVRSTACAGDDSVGEKPVCVDKGLICPLAGTAGAFHHTFCLRQSLRGDRSLSFSLAFFCLVFSLFSVASERSASTTMPPPSHPSFLLLFTLLHFPSR